MSGPGAASAASATRRQKKPCGHVRRRRRGTVLLIGVSGNEPHPSDARSRSAATPPEHRSHTGLRYLRESSCSWSASHREAPGDLRLPPCNRYASHEPSLWRPGGTSGGGTVADPSATKKLLGLRLWKHSGSLAASSAPNSFGGGRVAGSPATTKHPRPFGNGDTADTPSTSHSWCSAGLLSSWALWPGAWPSCLAPGRPGRRLASCPVPGWVGRRLAFGPGAWLFCLDPGWPVGRGWHHRWRNRR